MSTIHSLQLLARAQNVFIEDSLDGGAAEVSVLRGDGEIVEGKDYFNSTRPWSIRETRAGSESIAVGYRNCSKKVGAEWRCQAGGMYLGLPDFSEANVLSVSARETICRHDRCEIIGLCVAGVPTFAESEVGKQFWFAPDDNRAQCFIVRLKLPSLRLLSVDDTEYRDGQQAVRAHYRYDLDEPVRPLVLPEIAQ